MLIPEAFFCSEGKNAQGKANLEKEDDCEEAEVVPWQDMKCASEPQRQPENIHPTSSK